METSRQSERELRELRGLVERINRGDCVLVLGPRVAVRPGDPEREPLDSLLAQELIESIGVAGAEGTASSTTSIALLPAGRSTPLCARSRRGMAVWIYKLDGNANTTWNKKDTGST